MQAQHRAFLPSFVIIVAAACSGGEVEFPGDTAGQGGSASSGGGAGASSGSGSGAGQGSGGGAGEGGGGDTPCNLLTDGPDVCGPGYYCDAESCEAGTCAPIPANDDQTPEAVCGCDDVVYWNANTAAAHGVSVAKAGRCDEPHRCDGPSSMPCPQDKHWCGKIHEGLGTCNNAGGICWGLPDECMQVGFGGQYRPCLNPGGLSCLDECQAIMAETPHYHDSTCPQ